MRAPDSRLLHQYAPGFFAMAGIGFLPGMGAPPFIGIGFAPGIGILRSRDGPEGALAWIGADRPGPGIGIGLGLVRIAGLPFMGMSPFIGPPPPAGIPPEWIAASISLT